MFNRGFRFAGRLLATIVFAALTAAPASAQQVAAQSQYAQPALKSIPLRVQLGDVDITKIACVVAYENGFYKKNGLDVQQFISKGAAEIAKSRGLTVPAQYVREIKPDILITGATPLVVYRTMNAQWMDDRIVIASFDHIVHWQVVGRTDIARMEDLKGKRLGYLGFGDMTHFSALSIAKRLGWDPLFDISLVADGTTPDALKKGIVDAFIASEVPVATALAAGFKVIGDPRPWKMPIGGSGVIAWRGWLKNNHDTAIRFLKSVVESMALMKKDRNVASAAMAKWFNVTDPEQQKLLYDGNREMPTKPYPAVEGIKKTMELYDSHEMRQHKPEDFYDDSLIRELDKSGFIDGLYK